ncbi:5-hydroxytryptamine receptor 4 [Plakobranchus ocellatus]|uniref:5-hydroxytryptamine receptor 4 n=1 Tax=Plakobranchus ocellatus TaxID=259542 RepID=A0AAV4D5P9_9GAST|nr:5-hydroxytryptamine receptor 4 [Plakobranchus ocellatus]
MDRVLRHQERQPTNPQELAVELRWIWEEIPQRNIRQLALSMRRRIFYWAFLQMQILKQEANQTQKRKTRTSHLYSPVNSKQLQLERASKSTSVDPRLSGDSNRVSFLQKFKRGCSLGNINFFNAKGVRSTESAEAFTSEELKETSLDTLSNSFIKGPNSKLRKSSSSCDLGYETIISKAMWSDNRLIHDTDGSNEILPPQPEGSQNITHILFKAEVKAVIMIMALMGIFILCWIPFLIIEIMDIFQLDELTELDSRIGVVLVIVICALDPFTYALMNPPFRSVVVRSISGIFRKFRARGSLTESIQRSL